MNQKIKKLMKQGVLCELIVEKVYQKRTVAVMVTSVMNSMSKMMISFVVNVLKGLEELFLSY